MVLSEKIPVAVIGVGYLGQWHARKLAAMENARLVGVVDTESSRCNELAAELGCEAVEEYQKIAKLIRAAVVAVPTREHFKVAEYLLCSGVDLLVEKPITADIKEANSLLKIAEKENRVLAVGLVERFNPGVIAAVKAIDGPRWIETRRLSTFKERTRNVDVVRDLMIHDLDIARTIAGSEGKVIAATGVTSLTGIPDAVRAHVRFKNGVEAFLEASRMHDTEVRNIEVFDKVGRLMINTRDRVAIRYLPGPNGMESCNLPATKTDPLDEELRDFLQAVAQRSKPRVTARDGIEALRLAIDVLKHLGFS